MIIVPLYPSDAPGSEGMPNQEWEKDGIVGEVSRPTLTVMLPENPTGTGIIVCPGGGYNVLVIEREGVAIGRRLNELGIAAFILKYRMDGPEHAHALADAQHAIKVVKDTLDWSVMPGRLGLMGFSAGAHLAAWTCVSDGQRPDFAVPVYPRILDIYKRVDASCPPMFLVHAADDDVCPADDSVRLFTALNQRGIPVELHLFTRGGHGFDLGRPGSPSASWTDLMALWLQEQHLL